MVIQGHHQKLVNATSQLFSQSIIDATENTAKLLYKEDASKEKVNWGHSDGGQGCRHGDQGHEGSTGQYYDGCDGNPPATNHLDGEGDNLPKTKKDVLGCGGCGGNGGNGWQPTSSNFHLMEMSPQRS